MIACYFFWLLDYTQQSAPTYGSIVDIIQQIEDL